MKIQFSAGRDLYKKLQDRSLMISPALTAKEICARYFELCSRSLPWLSYDQWELMLLLGPPKIKETVPDWKKRLLYEMKDMHQSRDVRRLVRPEFIDRFNAFTFPEIVAIADKLLTALTAVKQA